VKINKEIKNIILKRLFITLGILLLIRLELFFQFQELITSDLAFYIQSHSVTRNLVSTFSGDDTFVIGLFTLNIFPYINASILFN
jgi:preprotein translocase subunit SecY